MANERFVANTERIMRFSEHLFLGGDETGIKKAGEGNNNSKKKEEEWEDGVVRQARKRAEGLKIKAEIRNNFIPKKPVVVGEEDEVDVPFSISTVSSE